MIARLAQWLEARRLVVPDHLLHADGSRYMERYWIFSMPWLSLRLHRICTADLDRHLHDHPWPFVSIVLSGSYIEVRPVTRGPAFHGGECELTVSTHRRAGSIALRHATDRHRIVCVIGDVWTLIFLGPLRQWWGFYTVMGKIYWRDYASCHAQAIGRDPTTAGVSERFSMREDTH